MSNLDQPFISEGLPIITLNNVRVDEFGHELYGQPSHVMLIFEDDVNFYGYRLGQEASKLLVAWSKASWRWANKGYWDAKNQEMEVRHETPIS